MGGDATAREAGDGERVGEDEKGEEKDGNFYGVGGDVVGDVVRGGGGDEGVEEEGEVAEGGMVRWRDVREGLCVERAEGGVEGAGV